MCCYNLSYDKNCWQQLLPTGRNVMTFVFFEIMMLTFPLFLLHFWLTTNSIMGLLELGDSDISELSDDDEGDYNAVLPPPSETQFGETDQDSDASDVGAESESSHLPRRVL